MPDPKRIANLVGPGAIGLGYTVPQAAVGDQFLSEQVETRVPNLFINDFDRAMTDLAYIDAALRAQDEGYAAVVINSVCDFGLSAMRDALSIPAIGAGQAGMQTAAGFGASFAIVTVWPETTRRMYARTLREYGFADRCLGIKYVTENADLPEFDGESGIMARMRSGGAPGTAGSEIVARIERACIEAIADGADAIMLGCTCMTPIHDELSQRLEHPVIDPLSAAHKFAEMRLTLGLREANPISAPLTVGMMRNFFDGSGVGSAVALTEDGCGDVCAVIGAPAMTAGLQA